MRFEIAPSVGAGCEPVEETGQGWLKFCTMEKVAHPLGPGNALVREIEAAQVTGVFTGFGERGRAAEAVARVAVEAAQAWLEAEVPVRFNVRPEITVFQLQYA